MGGIRNCIRDRAGGGFRRLARGFGPLGNPVLYRAVSIASGTHGLARQTNDIDVVADVAPERVTEFCAALSPAFYVDANSVEIALRTGEVSNAIHLKGAYKFDIFPIGDDRFARSELGRRRYATTTITGLENIEFPVASAEDTILAQLDVVPKRRRGVGPAMA